MPQKREPSCAGSGRPGRVSDEAREATQGVTKERQRRGTHALDAALWLTMSSTLAVLAPRAVTELVALGLVCAVRVRVGIVAEAARVAAPALKVAAAGVVAHCISSGVGVETEARRLNVRGGTDLLEFLAPAVPSIWQLELCLCWIVRTCWVRDPTIALVVPHAFGISEATASRVVAFLGIHLETIQPPISNRTTPHGRMPECKRGITVERKVGGGRVREETCSDGD